MSTVILPERSILHLPDAIEHHATGNVVLYGRVSSYTAKQKESLARQKYGGRDEIRKMIGERKIRAFHAGVEKGKLSAKRSNLLDAVAAAKRFKAILCARDVSRFIRSESYDRRKNWAVEPTAEEFDRLFELADGIILATYQDPMLTESERHSAATKNGARPCGRPSTLPFKLAIKILNDLGNYSSIPPARWETPIAVVAKRYGVTESQIKRLLESEIPGKPGSRLKYAWLPAEVYRKRFRPQAAQQ